MATRNDARFYSLLSLIGMFSFGCAIVRNGENVITKTRLVRVIDRFPSTWMSDWQCEDDFPVETCGRIRNGSITIDDVSVLSTDLTCAAGWTTVLPTDSGCTASCTPGWYGQDCAFQCRCLNGVSTCDRTDGTCDCFNGWKGHDCVTRCDLGEYGPNCAHSAYTCENSGVNHPVTGECLCPHSYRGNRCEDTCDPGFDPTCGFDCEKCTSVNGGTCDYIINICLCDPSWTGFYCTEPCKVGSYGLGCDTQCCSGYGHCDVENTRCLCLDGFAGNECSEICREGYFGRDCKEKCPCPSCNHVTGLCDICPPGYSGERCTDVCQPGKWGASCSSACTCQSSGGVCDWFTGQCIEDDVITPTSTPTPNDVAGTTPNDVAGTTPNDVAGTTQSEVVGTTQRIGAHIDSTFILAGSTIGGLLVAALFVILLWCACKRRTKKRRKTNYGNAKQNNVIPKEKRDNLERPNSGADNIYIHSYDDPPIHEYQELRWQPKTISYPRENINTITNNLPKL